jgi:hypothetical protein
VQALPKPVKFEGKTIRFESTYSQKGNVIHVVRNAVRSRPTEWCAPELWQETEDLSAAIARDARGQVLLQ